jgi:hypothetical protein
MGTPNYNSLLSVIWGNYYDDCGFPSVLLDAAAASNILVGDNPAYSAADFLSIYPQFANQPYFTIANIDGITNQFTVTDASNLIVGQLVYATGIQLGSTITVIAGNVVTINNVTTVAGTDVNFVAVASLQMPSAVLSAYIYLASTSVMQQRYQEMWQVCMSFFIAHYLTLYLQGTATTPNTTAAQVAASGLAVGLKTSKSAGDVSVGLEYVTGLEDWGTFNLTVYGQQFATIAKAIASGGVLIY